MSHEMSSSNAVRIFNGSDLQNAGITVPDTSSKYQD